MLGVSAHREEYGFVLFLGFVEGLLTPLIPVYLSTVSIFKFGNAVGAHYSRDYLRVEAGRDSWLALVDWCAWSHYHRLHSCCDKNVMERATVLGVQRLAVSYDYCRRRCYLL